MIKRDKKSLRDDEGRERERERDSERRSKRELK
jgi:hypothetical protein